MARIAIEGGRVVAKGAIVGGATAEAPTTGAGIVNLVSTVKFLRLLKMQPSECRKKTRTTAANGSRNKNPKIVGWQFQD